MQGTSAHRQQAEAQQALYRLLRLQNRENSFIYRDQDQGTQFKVHYPHFPLDTISHCDLLKTLWKLVGSHYFKTINQDELYRLNYITNLFQNHQTPTLPSTLQKLQLPQAFYTHLNSLFQSSYLQELYRSFETSIEGRIQFKSIFAVWARHNSLKKKQKIKKISKEAKPITSSKSAVKGKNKKKRLLLEKEEQLDSMINQLDFSESSQANENLDVQREEIDEQILRLEGLLQKNATQNLVRAQHIQAQIIKEQQRTLEQEKESMNSQDAECLKWLVFNLEEKQIAESVVKILNCQRKDGQTKFLIHYEEALNLQPQFLNERQLKKLNHLRQNSLLKCYRTGVKSTHAYTCQNYAGFSQLESRQGLISKLKDKDYLQLMKKMGSASAEIKESMDQFSMCHQCKFMYLPQFLVSCKFTSQRQGMPKVSETHTDFGHQLGLQKGRVSQRVVSKHRNCMTGYAQVNGQYVCGRKFCLSCLKDYYGNNYMKASHSVCPFCEGICNCTRCLRNEKINKLKTFYITLGGDLNQLQNNSLIDQLQTKKEQVLTKAKMKVKRPLKTKKIMRPLVNIYEKPNKKCKRQIDRGFQRGSVRSQELEKWSSTAQKQLQNNTIYRRSSRRGLREAY